MGIFFFDSGIVWLGSKDRMSYMFYFILGVSKGNFFIYLEGGGELRL